MPTCTCGRDISEVPHCPKCGRTYMYAKDSASRIVTIGGKQYKAQGFRCRRCAIDFYEGQPCNARPVGQSSASLIPEYTNQMVAQLKAELQSEKLQINALVNDVKMHPEKMTREREDYWYKKKSISLSERSGIPIIEPQISETKTVTNPTDDEPSFDLRDTDPISEDTSETTERN